MAIDRRARAGDKGRMGEVFIFGYGSLVNRRTHGYACVRRAGVRGWQRVWRYTPWREVAFLDVVRAPGHRLRGLVLGVPGVAPELDRRERAYRRIEVTREIDGAWPPDRPVSMFAIPPDRDDGGRGRGHVLLLSYIDVVAQGYLAEFGADGVHEFFETTKGWDAPVLDDRAAPRYPRAVSPDARLAALVDQWLETLGATIVPPRAAPS